MAQLVWDQVGERLYESGVKKGVLFVQNSSGLYPLGVAWNGLVSVSESPSGAEASPNYADDIKYVNIMSVEEFAATIEAFTYPDEFAACDGSAEVATGVVIGQQKRSVFGLAYQTSIGNDVDGFDHGKARSLCSRSPTQNNRIGRSHRSATGIGSGAFGTHPYLCCTA